MAFLDVLQRLGFGFALLTQPEWTDIPHPNPVFIAVNSDEISAVASSWSQSTGSH